MKHVTDIQEDVALDWAMRIVGLTVFAASVFFIYRDLSLSVLYDYFFAMTALVGIATVAATWIRPSASPEWVRHQPRYLETVRQRSDR